MLKYDFIFCSDERLCPRNIFYFMRGIQNAHHLFRVRQAFIDRSHDTAETPQLVREAEQINLDQDEGTDRDQALRPEFYAVIKEHKFYDNNKGCLYAIKNGRKIPGKPCGMRLFFGNLFERFYFVLRTRKRNDG